MAWISEQRRQAVLSEYELALTGARLAGHSRRAYRSRVAGYLHWLVNATADPANPSDVGSGDPLADPRARDAAVGAYHQWLRRTQRAAPTTVNATRTALDHFYRHLRLGPASTGREQVPASVRRALPADAQRALLTTLDQYGPSRDRAIAYTLLFTGVRVAELVGLDLPDVRLAARASQRLVADRGGTRQRELPLAPPARPPLRAWLAERRQWSNSARTPALFLNRRGGRLSSRSVDELIAQWGRRAGVADASRPLTPQVLRHTFGANLLAAGEEPSLVASRLGHRQPAGDRPRR